MITFMIHQYEQTARGTILYCLYCCETLAAYSNDQTQDQRLLEEISHLHKNSVLKNKITIQRYQVEEQESGTEYWLNCMMAIHR